MNLNPNEGAGIKCVECGARPYPEIALPEIVRQDFDLRKIGDEWRCSQHRKIKKVKGDGDEAETPSKGKKSLSRINAVDDLESALGKLSHHIANAGFEDVEDESVADALVDEAQALLMRLRAKMTA
jgi:hypothetical protein